MYRYSPDREYTWLAQTPQVFGLTLYRTAAYVSRDENFKTTDDNQLAEYIHVPVKMVRCSRENLKVTEPLDLLIAQVILDERAKVGEVDVSSDEALSQEEDV